MKIVSSRHMRTEQTKIGTPQAPGPDRAQNYVIIVSAQVLLILSLGLWTLGLRNRA